MSDWVYINGIGVCTSLGVDRATTQALYGAGKKKFFKDPAVTGRDGRPITYAPVFPVLEVLDIPRRFQGLVAHAIADLLAQAPHTDKRAHVILTLPAWLRELSFGHQITDWPALADWQPCQFDVVWSDQSNVVRALIAGQSQAIDRPARDVIVIAADTYLRAELLDLLGFKNRILSKSQPHGIIPSEAAVAIRLTPQDRALLDIGVGWIDGHWQGQEAQDVTAPTDMLGEALAQVVNAGASHQPVDRLLVDANGERWRSEELSMAFARTTAVADDLVADFETPPLLTGFSGFAMPAVMIALAMGDGPRPADRDAITQRQLLVTSALAGDRDTLGLIRQLPQKGTT